MNVTRSQGMKLRTVIKSPISSLFIPTPYKRSYATTTTIESIKSFIRPRLFNQQIVLSNGATYTLRTTSPKPRMKLIKDTRNHPLWNPSESLQTLDESGQLSKFVRR